MKRVSMAALIRDKPKRYHLNQLWACYPLMRHLPWSAILPDIADLLYRPIDT